MVSIGRPSIFPSPSAPWRSEGSWVSMKPWPSPRGLGTINMLMPRWALDLSGSVRTRSISTSARAPKVHQVLTPLTSQPPSVGVAVAVMPATSEPKSGSVTATAFMTSAVASLGSQVCFCSSVPPASRARARISGRVISEPPAPSEARESSSVAMTMPM